MSTDKTVAYEVAVPVGGAPDVVFVGVGAIGLPMATRLKLGGHRITAVDPFPTARAKAEDTGLSTAASILEVLPFSGVVVVMVATAAQLSELVTTALGVGAVLPDQTWIVMSTVGPDAVRIEAGRLSAAGARVLDVPVTGGVARASTGELTLFASGDRDVIEEERQLLGCLGTVRVVGTAIGEGQSVKVVNQHLCSIHIVAAAEALALAARLGLDPGAVLDLVSSGAGGSWMLNDRGPRMLEDTDVTVTSTIGIFVKDSNLVATAADQLGADIPLLRAAQERYTRAVELGLERRDDSRVIETYQVEATARSDAGER
ncbi:NAD(P)-dependent oxidoreductase [Kineococcus rhizosphaerae]|uniref:3-hydroxyisobutyrate dehydrogenase n=1 Tax=Kineococcus rhizosphaerae TaxID=559628 RepID=A0A2T0QSG9_9ACTN|nr:NAD(P)-dependent oxidoreductase [Kineococcus rhizosphaerae]PRY07806.1 3-hydroxyisobutyrate dehydrogenase [Kineococcus rhizosphaerae]